ncbi:hypothetical protein [Arthrobacter sp. U41]|uniref:hypothetical protein n=1 Tax=Arthrobacter sp. U41 TaxID=1849032 RepID=UPI0012F9FDA5|nr:hypothetical protein [Arthrobacter sp. U41]
MGFFSKRSDKLMTAALSVPVTPTLSLPAGVLSETLPLAAVIFPDLDLTNYPVTVSEAMAVPAVSRAIALYSTLSSRFVLDSEDNSTPWLSTSAGYITPQMRIARTVQDLIFHNCSLWQVERDTFGTITDAQHVEKARWSVDSLGVLKVDDNPLTAAQFIYFGGLLPGAGFLESGRHSVRQYTSISATVNARANNPAPVTVVAETVDGGADPEEVTQAMDDLEAAGRAGVRNAQVFQPYGLEFKAFGGPDNANEFMTSARNAVRLDLANHLNINASLLEGSADGSSDSYTNTLMTQNELLELSLKGYTEPICDRLTAELGVKVSFDYSTFDTAPNDSSDKGVVPVPTEEV